MGAEYSLVVCEHLNEIMFSLANEQNVVHFLNYLILAVALAVDNRPVDCSEVVVAYLDAEVPLTLVESSKLKLNDFMSIWKFLHYFLKTHNVHSIEKL